MIKSHGTVSLVASTRPHYVISGLTSWIEKHCILLARPHTPRIVRKWWSHRPPQTHTVAPSTWNLFKVVKVGTSWWLHFWLHFIPVWAPRPAVKSRDARRMAGGDGGGARGARMRVWRRGDPYTGTHNIQHIIFIPRISFIITNQDKIISNVFTCTQ